MNRVKTSRNIDMYLPYYLPPILRIPNVTKVIHWITQLCVSSPHCTVCFEKARVYLRSPIVLYKKKFSPFNNGFCSLKRVGVLCCSDPGRFTLPWAHSTFLPRLPAVINDDNSYSQLTGLQPRVLPHNSLGIIMCAQLGTDLITKPLFSSPRTLIDN